MPVAETASRRLLIVDDHELLAQALAAALAAEGLDVQRATSLEPEAVIHQAEDVRPDVVLLDLHLIGASALPMVRPLHDLGSTVVMVTGETDRARLAECVEAGAVGVVAKSAPFDELVAAISEAAELGSLLTKHQREELLGELRRQRAEERTRLEAFQRLTPKEQWVLGRLIEGDSAEMIAADAVVSLATVRSQIKSILTKLGVHSQLSAVALARSAGWEPGRS
jgi:DNA-binding NarL/FixJ family response regulator